MKTFTRFILPFVMVMWGSATFASNTPCSGTSTVAAQGSFTLGYNYSFTTSGTSVTATFELLDVQVGIVAYIWNYTSGFAETQMTNSSGQTFTQTLSGLTLGSVIQIACKFGYQGGMAVTKTFTYVVGDNCSAFPASITSTPAAATGTSVDNLVDNIATSASLWKVATNAESSVVYGYSEAKVFNKVTLTAGDNTGRAPKNFTIEASNDNSSWTVLGTQTDQTSWVTYTSKSYLFSNAAAYLYYRLHTTSVNGSSSSTTLSELSYSYLIPDAEAPTGLTATAGTITGSSVELLLNSTDNAGGNITYSISYGSVPTVVTTSSASGVQKSFTVSGLAELTSYTFSVTAIDASNNVSAAVTVHATTIAIPAPAVAPTAPVSRPVSNVISIYGSDTYTPITDVNMLIDWGSTGQGSTMSEFTIAGTSHKVIKYGKLSYQGIDFNGNRQNCSSMLKLHLDIWTNDAAATPLHIYLINAATEMQTPVTLTTSGTWNSVEIALTDYPGLDLSTIRQMKIVSDEWITSAKNTLSKDIYVDNIYFYNNASADTTIPVWDATTPIATGSIDEASVELLLKGTDNNGTVSYSISDGTNTTTATGVSGTVLSKVVSGLMPSTNYTFTVTLKDPTGNEATTTKQVTATTGDAIPSALTPTMPSSNVIGVYTDAYTCAGGSFGNWDGSTMKEVPTATVTNKAEKITSSNCLGFNLPANTDVTSMTRIHADIYSKTLASLNFGLVAPAGQECKLPVSLTADQWTSIDFNLSSLLAVNTGCDFTKVSQIGFWGLSGAFYVDNILFYTGTYSSANGLNSVIAENGIKCYPSIATDRLTVKANSEIEEVSIVNLIGQITKTESINAFSKTIDLNNIADGQYIVKVKLANGQIGALKFVKQ